MVDTPAAAQLYVPRFNVMDADDVRPFVHAVATAQLVTVGDDGLPDATFLPVLWEGRTVVRPRRPPGPSFATIGLDQWKSVNASAP